MLSLIQTTLKTPFEEEAVDEAEENEEGEEGRSVIDPISDEAQTPANPS
jgi:hypothetical protein